MPAAVNGRERAGDLPRVVGGRRGRERVLQSLAEAAGAQVLHRDVGVIVGDAEVENAHDVGVAHARDDLVFLQEPVEQAPAADVGNVAQHLERDPLATVFGLGEIDGRQVARIELRDEPALASAVQRLVIRRAARPSHRGARTRSSPRTTSMRR